MMCTATQNFDILVIKLRILHNYFDSSTKFSDLCLTKYTATVLISVLFLMIVFNHSRFNRHDNNYLLWSDVILRMK